MILQGIAIFRMVFLDNNIMVNNIELSSIELIVIFRKDAAP